MDSPPDGRPQEPGPGGFALRRPPVLSIVDGPFVPTTHLDEVERRWSRLRRANPAYFDGRLYHVLGVHRNGCGGATMHVMDCAYRFHAVQDETFDLGVRPLGVKAFTHRDGRVLMGRRARHVAANRDLWEYAPGGVVEPGRQPREVIAAELTEETDLAAERGPTPVAVLFDPTLRCWEIVYRIEAAAGEPTPNPREYDELRWCEQGKAPGDLAPVAKQMRALGRG